MFNTKSSTICSILGSSAVLLAANISAATFNNDGEPWAVSSSEVTRIEAEDYDRGGNGGAWLDTTLDNVGGQYRVAGPDIEISSDIDGVYNVGWMRPGEHLQYTVDIAETGFYEVALRVARAPQGIGFVRLGFDSNGDESCTEAALASAVSIPSTGGWQSWETITFTVELRRGERTLQLQVLGDDFYVLNLNWLSLKKL